jgi:hypothetical protein
VPLAELAVHLDPHDSPLHKSQLTYITSS